MPVLNGLGLLSSMGRLVHKLGSVNLTGMEDFLQVVRWAVDPFIFYLGAICPENLSCCMAAKNIFYSWQQQPLHLSEEPCFYGWIPCPFFSTIVLCENQPFSLGSSWFPEKKDPWKEWGRYPWNVKDSICGAVHQLHVMELCEGVMPGAVIPEHSCSSQQVIETLILVSPWLITLQASTLV